MPPRVQGWCYLRKGERVFRLDRMRTVEPAGRPYDIPDFETQKLRQFHPLIQRQETVRQQAVVLHVFADREEAGGEIAPGRRVLAAGGRDLGCEGNRSIALRR